MGVSYRVQWRATGSAWFVLLMLFMVPSGSFAVEPLVFGVHPYRPHNELRQMFQPLAHFLGRQIGLPVEVRIGESYRSHQEAIMRGSVDFAYIGPSLYVQLIRQKMATSVLARLEVNGKPTFTGKIIARESGGVHKISDLKQCLFAFGSPSSTMSHLVPRQMLFEAGIDLDDLEGHRFYNNHNNVALAVLAGDADAGAVKEAVYEKYRDQGIIAIGTTAEISEHLFIAPAGSDPELTRRLKQALLSLNNGNPQTAAVLRPIKKTATALVEAKAEDYRDLRDILDALRERGVQW